MSARRSHCRLQNRRSSPTWSRTEEQSYPESAKAESAKTASESWASAAKPAEFRAPVVAASTVFATVLNPVTASTAFATAWNPVIGSTVLAWSTGPFERSANCPRRPFRGQSPTRRKTRETETFSQILQEPFAARGHFHARFVPALPRNCLYELHALDLKGLATYLHHQGPLRPESSFGIYRKTRMLYVHEPAIWPSISFTSARKVFLVNRPILCSKYGIPLDLSLIRECAPKLPTEDP